jgi:hypothetical protein
VFDGNPKCPSSSFNSVMVIFTMAHTCRSSEPWWTDRRNLRAGRYRLHRLRVTLFRGSLRDRDALTNQSR